MEETQYGDRSAEAMIFDLVLLRPVGIAAWLTGTAVWIVALPFSAPSGNSDEAADTLMKAPADFAFDRQLGDLNY
jgi:hypothetical protein